MALRKLSELADWQVSDEGEDIRGHEVYERDGGRLGTVDEMLVDTDAKLVRSIILDNGQRFSADDIDIEGNRVYLSKEHAGQTHAHRPKVEVYRHEGGTSRPTAP
jgi:sporulation protein YlmC with PRC-barrel domain